MPFLVTNPCRAICAWQPVPGERDGLPLFACHGCGSEWVRTEGWTPAGADGRISPAVAVEAARRGTEPD